MGNAAFVNIQDIQCPEIRNNIELCTKAVSKFLSLINSQFPADEQLGHINIFRIVREHRKAYEDDKKTPCPGYYYRIFWAFPLRFVESVNDVKFLYDEDDCDLPNLIYICLKENERCFDHSERSGRTLTIQVIGTYDEYSFLPPIDSNNEKYPLLSILIADNAIQNAIRCVLKIRELYEWNRIKVSMLKVQQRQDA